MRVRNLLTAASLVTFGLAGNAVAQQPQRPQQQGQQPQLQQQQQTSQQGRPNILFIMGDDIGWMQPSIYHRGLMVGETPNIDRIGREGAIFMDYYAEQSCTAGRNAFFTGMHPLRTGMIPPQLPGSCGGIMPVRSGYMPVTKALRPEVQLCMAT